jgi:hypothetical protein
MRKYKGTVRTRGALVGSLGLALALGTPSYSSAQIKEGTYKGTYTCFGKAKAMPVGKDRILVILSDENGQTLSDGFLDHAVWQCWGIGDYTKGIGHEHGQCMQPIQRATKSSIIGLRKTTSSTPRA